jgi:DDE superfamily endonuclease
MTSDDLWPMEDSLYQYARPYDPLTPLICYDERPCQLLGDVLGPIPMQPGQPKRYDHDYERHGTCCVLLAFEPHTGFRSVQVRARRTIVDYAQFLQELVRRHYPRVEQIRLVQDNLTTHTPGALYQVLPPEEAFQFAQLFELHDTPKTGSWLTRAEIAFAARATQCLERRIPDRDKLATATCAWARKRNNEHKTVNWHFTQTAAREKRQRRYPMLTD